MLPSHSRKVNVWTPYNNGKVAAHGPLDQHGSETIDSCGKVFYEVICLFLAANRLKALIDTIRRKFRGIIV